MCAPWHPYVLLSAQHSPGEHGGASVIAEADPGDLLTAAVALGADTDLLDEAWWCPGIELPDGRGAFLVGVYPRRNRCRRAWWTATSTSHFPTINSAAR